MTAETLRLIPLPAAYFIYRLPPEAPLPPGLGQKAGVFCARTVDELSLLVPADHEVPSYARREGPWRGFRVAGMLDFALVGVLARVSGVLAAAGVPILAISTFDTDYFWVPADRWPHARRALARNFSLEDAHDG